MLKQLSALSLCFATGNIPSYPSWTWRFWKLWSSITNWWMRAPCTQPTPNSSTLHNSHPPLESPCRSVSLEPGNSLLLSSILKKPQQKLKWAHEQSDIAWGDFYSLCKKFGFLHQNRRFCLATSENSKRSLSIIHFLQLELCVAAAWWVFLLWVMSISKSNVPFLFNSGDGRELEYQCINPKCIIAKYRNPLLLAPFPLRKMNILYQFWTRWICAPNCFTLSLMMA